MPQRLGPPPGRFERIRWRSIRRRESAPRRRQRVDRLQYPNGLRDPTGKTGSEKTFWVVAQPDGRGDQQAGAMFERASFENLREFLSALRPQSVVQNHDPIGRSGLQSRDGVVCRRNSGPYYGVVCCRNSGPD